MCVGMCYCEQIPTTFDSDRSNEYLMIVLILTPCIQTLSVFNVGGC